MLSLTFGEQVKIILSRKGMTIKELAETIEKHTGKKMSRQNLTQRLGRDNFQEQDMRMIAEILECPFYLNILDESTLEEKSHEKNHIDEKQGGPAKDQGQVSSPAPERDITIGELVDMHEDLRAMEEHRDTDQPGEETPVEELLQELTELVEENGADSGQIVDSEEEDKKAHGWRSYLKRHVKKAGGGTSADWKSKEQEKSGPYIRQAEPLHEELYANGAAEQEASWEESLERYVEDAAQEGLFPEDEDIKAGDVNPYTGREYESNSVRMHPSRIGYVQVYDRGEHEWTDMTEWAFLGYQERKKALLGKDYEPPIYLD